jgi:hypothetical protein
MDLVKEYPLDGDRGTVAQWLQYSFTPNPGDANKEEWTAGAVEAGAYIVQYRVLPGAKSGNKEPISYLFEADVERKTVRGKNPAARELMAGQPAAQPPRKPQKARTKTVRRPAAKPAAPKDIPLAPLPSDADLLPPADDDARFKNDTVNPPL